MHFMRDVYGYVCGRHSPVLKSGRRTFAYSYYCSCICTIYRL